MVSILKLLERLDIRNRKRASMRLIAFFALASISYQTFGSNLPGAQWHDLIASIAQNPSREAALTEQESSWNIFAESPFAKGLRQITPDTEDWLELGICSDLGPADSFDPVWSLKCGIRYAESLQTNDYGGYCDNRRIAEMRYNGGFWIIWELRTAKSVSVKDAERFCGQVLYNGRKRSRRSCDENYEYPKRIDERQMKYVELGGKSCWK